jgi:bile acid-coenzyme A ligase
MTTPVPPIGTQFSRLAEIAPDEPAVTCEGRTLTRGELDTSTNRLAPTPNSVCAKATT